MSDLRMREISDDMHNAFNGIRPDLDLGRFRRLDIFNPAFHYECCICNNPIRTTPCLVLVFRNDSHPYDKKRLVWEFICISCAKERIKRLNLKHMKYIPDYLRGDVNGKEE